ncbi:M28 family peptidase [Flavobacteriaceae bacterium F89]|uniref:M28 family peptidase n=1 Tax=Cerina litoralis TaxID=2874477 RepID=A0AAE3JR16_9FLAO|nr:M28 family peptidase [Cerina litoralis]MCG2462479.1 M28 family peptidase [Cerina litoralis]
MQKLIYLTLGLVMACCNATQNTTTETAQPSRQEVVDPRPYAEVIKESDLKKHLYIYASDEFEGRETGKPGQKKAVAYLKGQYEKMGIPAAKSDGDYFQEVPLVEAQLPTGSVTINGTTYPIGEDILSTMAITGDYGQIVYAAYGIEDGDYSDYEGMDVSGKLVLIKMGEPISEDGTYTLTGTNEKSIWSNVNESLKKREQIAAEKGAKGLLYYDKTYFTSYKNTFERLKAKGNTKMNLKDPNLEDKMSTIFIDATVAKSLLPDIDTNDNSKILPATITMGLKNADSIIQSENVAAVIKGSEKPNEYLIISAHLDHIGINKYGEINNGADDDGSGTVAVLEIAKAFKKAVDEGHRPKRSVVFLHVTGEEKGLLGSRYYTDVDPIFPLSQTVADLNIDMIGRIDPERKGDRNYVYLIGSDKLSTELHNLSEEVNSNCCQLELDYTYNDDNDPNRFYYRSDHYNFAKHNIPIIFYFNGVHEDYHQPGDTPDKINYDLLENRARLVFYTAWEVANRQHRVAVDPDKAVN